MSKLIVVLSVLALGLLAPGPVEELEAIVGAIGPGSYRGQARRVSRRTARRTSRRVAYRHEAAYAAAGPVVATTTVVTAPAAYGGLPPSAPRWPRCQQVARS